MKTLEKKAYSPNAAETEEVDSLISELIGGSVPTPAPSAQTPGMVMEYGGSYQLPVRVGKAGMPLDKGDKPWVVGTFLPGQYVNETHPQGHEGVDLKAPRGTPVYSIGPGVVIDNKETPKGGKTARISHENGKVISYYAHMDSVNARPGQQVNGNIVIGTVGDTGNAKGRGAHLHYEVSVDGVKINPFQITGKQVGTLSKKAEDIVAMFDILNKYAKTSRLSKMKKVAAKLEENFTLTDKEQKIFNLLRNVVKDKAPDTTLRAAGGWVRDKLLGKESHDIDIAVDNMSGAAFANLVLQWMKENNIPGAKSVTKVEANPEANKNLETAILPILGTSIDFVQLRKDTYNEDSRNPEIQVGVSPEEDAQRRDLTINSIFYNVNDGKIEDYVGGVEDLKNNIARTPIDPLRTYLEDPLRILRAVRFAAKYDLQLDPALIQAAKDPKVQDAFRNKITKERIWAELVGQQEGEGWKRGLMIGPNFHRAAELLGVLGLRDLLLTPSKEQMERAVTKQQKLEPNEEHPEAKPRKWEKGFTTWELQQNNPHHDLDVWNHTLAALKYLHQLHQTNISEGRKMKETDEIVRNLAMLFHDIGKCDICSRQEDPRGYSTYHEHELSSAAIAEEILTDLKAPTDIKNRIVGLVKNHMRLHTLPEGVSGAGLRRIVRDVGEDWPNLVEMSKSDAMGKTMAKDLPAKYDAFAKVIDQFLARTGGKSEVQPPINGKEIMSALGLMPGAQVGVVVKALKEKLLDEPEMTKEQALAFIKTIPLG